MSKSNSRNILRKEENSALILLAVGFALFFGNMTRCMFDHCYFVFIPFDWQTIVGELLIIIGVSLFIIFRKKK